MNVGYAHNPYETCDRMERIDHWHTRAGDTLANEADIRAHSHLADECSCKYTLEFRVEHGRNELETYGNLIRRIEEIAAQGRGET